MGYVAIAEEEIMSDMMDIAYGTTIDPTGLQYEVTFHTTKYDLTVDFLESIEILGDYVNNVSDYLLVTLLFPMGDYVKDVLPYSENLEMSITYIYYSKRTTVRYKAILSNNKGGVHSGMYDGMTREEINKSEMVNLELQLVDRMVEVLRTTHSDGIYNYADVSTSMKFAFKEKLYSDIKRKNDIAIVIEDKDLTNTVIDIVPPDNTEVYRHVNVPFGMNVLDIPTFFQVKEYGVYNGGIGTYIKLIDILSKDYLPVGGRYSYSVYPIYNNKRYDEPVRKILILSVTIEKFRHIEKSYKLDDKTLKIISSGNSINTDDGDNTSIDKGTGIIALNEEVFLNMYENKTDPKAESKTKDNLLTATRLTRADSITKLNYIGSEYNVYRHNTEMNKRKYMLVQVTWNYSNPELLLPGMPVAYVYKHTDYGVIKLKGTLVSSFSKYSKVTKTISTVLNMLVEKPYDPEKVKESSVIDLR